MSKEILTNINHICITLMIAIFIFIMIKEIKRVKLKSVFRKKNRLARTNMKLDLKNQEIKIAYTKIEKLHIRYIQKSGAMEHLPFIDIYTLCVFNIFVGCIFTFIIFMKFMIIEVAVVFFIIGSTLPFVLIDIVKVNKQKKIRLSMPALLSSMSRWSAINEDVIFCMNKCLSSEIPKEIKKYSKIFLLK